MAMHPIKLASDKQRALAKAYVDKMPDGGIIRFDPEPKRSIEQNAKMWAMLGDIAKQAEHMGHRQSPETWKALFMHACGHEVRFISGLNGEPFPAGFRSSQLTVPQMSELIEFMHYWAAQNGIQFVERGF